MTPFLSPFLPNLLRPDLLRPEIHSQFSRSFCRLYSWSFSILRSNLTESMQHMYIGTFLYRQASFIALFQSSNILEM